MLRERSLADNLKKIYITDTTLRDGQQGWRYFTLEESLKIYDVLVEIGGRGSIRSTELFLYTEKDRQVAREILARGSKYPKPVAWVRSTLEDLRLVAEAGLDEAVVLMSISDYHIAFKLGLSRQQAFEKYLGVAEEAYKRGIVVKASLEDVTRADVEGSVIPFLERLRAMSERYGVELKVKLPDTLGVGLPFESAPLPRGIPALVTRLREALGLDPEAIEFHAHNDLGLAVANQLAAWVYGAASANVTLLGIGERAGNCPLEVMAVHYAGIKGLGDINLRAIRRAVSLLEEMGYRVPEHAPVVGRNAFKTKAGIHADGLLKNPEVYLPFDPHEVLGAKYGVEITPYSGRAAIVLWLRQHMGIDHLPKDDPIVAEIHEEVRRLFESTGRREPLTDEEMEALARSVLSKRGVRGSASV